MINKWFILSLMVLLINLCSFANREPLLNDELKEAIEYGVSSVLFYGDNGGSYKDVQSVQGEHDVDVLECKGDVYDGYYYVTVHPYDTSSLVLIRAKDKFYYVNCVSSNAPKDFQPIKVEKYFLDFDNIGFTTILDSFKATSAIIANLKKQLPQFVERKGKYDFYVAPFGLKDASVEIFNLNDKSVVDISRALLNGEDYFEKINGAQTKISDLDEAAYKQYMDDGYLPKVLKYGQKITIRK